MSDFLNDLQKRNKDREKREEVEEAALIATQEQKEVEEEVVKEEPLETSGMENSTENEEPISESEETVPVEHETEKSDEEETVRVVEKEIEVPVEVEKVIQVETIPMELFKRILEHVHSNIRTSGGIKQITSKVQGLIEDHGVLSLDDYEDILNSVQEPEQSTEKLYREGATATNPSTGEKLVYRSGKWRPCDECQQ